MTDARTPMTRQTVLALIAAAVLGLGAPAQAQPFPHDGPGHRHPGPPARFHVLPAIATLVTIGAVSYWLVDGAYYRRVADGYERVAPPTAVPVDGDAGSQRLYIYPRNGQSAEKQASDEYECHRWAVEQTRFDPTAQATGEATDVSQREAYRRAQTACLEGRGYTVR